MLIILEGVDGAGKTTLAREITAALRAAYPGDQIDEYHKAPPRQHPLSEYEVPLYRYRPGRNHHVVCDRWHVGEAIYPEVLERLTSWDVAVQRHIELFLRSRGALLVHVNPPMSVLRRRVRERGDDLIGEHQLLDLQFRYDRYVRDSILLTQRVASTATPFIVEKIISAARTLDQVSVPLSPHVTYVGPTAPAYLILGDARHELKNSLALAREGHYKIKPEQTINNGPAFGPYPSTSGHFLLKYLPEDLWRQSLGLANACDVDSVVALLRTLGNPPTIALGVNAWRELRDVDALAGGGGQIAAAPHPQYVRRFLNRHGEAYGRLIADAVVYGKNELGWRGEQ